MPSAFATQPSATCAWTIRARSTSLEALGLLRRRLLWRCPPQRRLVLAPLLLVVLEDDEQTRDDEDRAGRAQAWHAQPEPEAPVRAQDADQHGGAQGRGDGVHRDVHRHDRGLRVLVRPVEQRQRDEGAPDGLVGQGHDHAPRNQPAMGAVPGPVRLVGQAAEEVYQGLRRLLMQDDPDQEQRGTPDDVGPEDDHEGRVPLGQAAVDDEVGGVAQDVQEEEDVGEANTAPSLVGNGLVYPPAVVDYHEGRPTRRDQDARGLVWTEDFLAEADGDERRQDRQEGLPGGADDGVAELDADEPEKLVDEVCKTAHDHVPGVLVRWKDGPTRAEEVDDQAGDHDPLAPELEDYGVRVVDA
mmetsp:Transcript_16238/g.47426  ORF Transcript_16238/g.47426 Transcript_16238/m.47426 type:complete len:356 (-) Transcript_16238:275-1342(-)